MKYNNHLNYKKRKRFILKVRIFLISVFTISLVGGVYYYQNYFKIADSNPTEETTSEKTASFIAPSIRIFKSPYFQFQASSTWAEVPGSSSANKFVYNSVRSNLIQHELTIYVNQAPANLAATKVLSVTPTDSNTRLVGGELSEDCPAKVPANHQSIFYEITLVGIKFNCDRTNAGYSVFAGTKENGTQITMIRPDGTTAVYTFLYKDLRAENDASEFINLLSTFQTR